jgi:ribosomal peptide maturation radical SAM protein 1
MTPSPHADVHLILMPYASVERPSIALGLLKALLLDGGISATVRYANLSFVDEVGFDVLALAQRDRSDLCLGDWSFSSAAFPEHAGHWSAGSSSQPKPEMRTTFSSAFPDELKEAMALLQSHAARFVKTQAEQILDQNPKIVGCSSTFEQQVASLALLRQIKQMAPHVTTLLGGANCEKEMGWATVREFPWVDYVVSGEADEIIVPLCRSILEKGSDIPLEQIPRGALGRQHVEAGTYGGPDKPIPRGMASNLDGLPTPEYSDYFNALQQSSLAEAIRPGLVAETSRGCWWGEVSHCKFCGLNGEGMTFRRKSPERALSEIRELASRWNKTGLEIVDNIIDHRYLKTLLPALEAAPEPFEFFYETKSNLRRDQVSQMAAAGIRWIQPGIESLHDSLLELMGKGCTATTNVQLLKYARERGMRVSWGLLTGFPLEKDQWHEEVASWIPRLEHLQPPSGCITVRFDRFSPYFESQEEFGLQLAPYPAFSDLYPLGEEVVSELAYFFVDQNNDDPVAARPGVRKLSEAVTAWMKRFQSRVRPVLSMVDRGEEVEIFDTRDCALTRRTCLKGLEARIYRACEPAQSETSLLRTLEEDGGNSPAPLEIEEAIHSLDERKLILRVHGKILALALEGEIPSLPVPTEFPGGWFKTSLPTRRTLEAAMDRLRDLTPSPILESPDRNPLISS